MKNKHVLPTDKPSRLFLNKVNKKLLLDDILNPSLKKVLPSGSYQNIYITSDEIIKEGWNLNTSIGINKPVYVKSEDVKPLKSFYNDKPSHLSKIILTTDQDLIADGVQAIDDEFLEWFVKNPSCEFVETDKIDSKIPKKEVDGYFSNETFLSYKIIIPQEEQKQDRTCTNNCSVVCGECQIFEPKQETLTYTESAKKEERIFNSTMIKQETLEETAERLATNRHSRSTSSWYLYKNGIIEGAKWQQERIYEIMDAYADDVMGGCTLRAKEWFKEFKNK